MTLKTRTPTGRVPYPVLLLEGEEKAGKSYAAALLSASDKVGRTFWIDLGEGAADEYGAIPGTRYEVVEHDGTYASILQAVLDVKAEAQRLKDAGEPPTVLVIDSMSALWEGLKDWVRERAKRSRKNQEKLRQDPDAEVDVPRNLWNDAEQRYRRIMTPLLLFPGIVVLTARGKSVSATDPATGQPYRDGRRAWSVEGHKNLPYDATIWVRMTRTERPVVIGARSVHVGLRPGKDDPKPITTDPENLLEWLVFDVLKVDPGNAHTRDLRDVKGGDLTDDERADDPEEANPSRQRPKQDPAYLDSVRERSGSADIPGLRALWKEVDEKTKAGEVGVTASNDLKALIEARVHELAERAANPAHDGTWPKTRQPGEQETLEVAS